MILEGSNTEQLSKERPPAHHIGDKDSSASFTYIPDLVHGGKGGGKVEVFIQDSGNDREQTQAHHAEQQHLPV